jgi:hypothetical protein
VAVIAGLSNVNVNIFRLVRVLRCRFSNRSCSSSRSFVLLTSNEPDSDQSRDEPETSTDERECLSGPPASTEAAVTNLMEVEGWAVTIVFDPVDEDAKDCEPGEGYQDIDGPDVEGASSWDEPNQSEQDGDAGDDDRVDVASQWPVDITGIVVEVVTDDACNDLLLSVIILCLLA